MSASMRVAMLIGSVRYDGISARVARTLAKLAPPTLELITVPIVKLPFYDQNDEPSPPSAVITFRDAVHQMDGVLFVTAEYNRGIPAVLKNAIDVGSRPFGKSVFAGKPAAIVSQSPGAMGGVCANHALRPSLMALDMPVLAQPEMYLVRANKMFDAEGDLTAAAPLTLMTGFLATFTAWVELHQRKEN